MTVTKQQLIEAAAEATQTSKANAEKVVNCFLAGIGNALAEGERVAFRELGVFTRISRPARLGRNPRTGAPMPIPARHSPKFRPSRALAQLVDQYAAAAE